MAYHVRGKGDLLLRHAFAADIYVYPVALRADGAADERLPLVVLVVRRAGAVRGIAAECSGVFRPAGGISALAPARSSPSLPKNRASSLLLPPMSVASLIVSVVAVAISAGSVLYARRSAAAAQQSARASEGTLAIERARRLDERRPHLVGQVESVNGGKWHRLRITLDQYSHPLTGLDVTIRQWQGIAFNRGVQGVIAIGPDKEPLRAFAFDPGGNRTGVKPGDTVMWMVDLAKDYPDRLRLDVACHGEGGDRWDLVLDAEVEDTIA